MHYPCRIRKTYLGEFEATFPDFPSFVQYYLTEQEALDALGSALVDAMAHSIAASKKIPQPSRKTADELYVEIDNLTMAQVQLYNQNVVQ